jgi:hypothetical protein
LSSSGKSTYGPFVGLHNGRNGTGAYGPFEGYHAGHQ